MNFYFVTIHYKSRISEDFGDFQYTSLLGAYKQDPQKFIDLLTDAKGIVLPFGEMYEI